jgi:transmembrane sensor
MTSNDTHSRDGIAEDAAAWFVENSQPLNRRSRAAFMSWLKTSPVHVEEYLHIAALARDLPTAGADPSLDVESLLARASTQGDNILPLGSTAERRSAPRRTGAWSWQWLTAACAALLFLAATAIWRTRDNERLGLPLTYRTARAEQRVQPLPDGSILHLNTDSQVTVRFSPAERVVELTRGQAFFEVAHAPGRRFRIDAGSTGVIAVGTQFDVYRKAGAVVVTVVEGSVAVYAGHPPPLAPSGLHAPDTARVDAGYQLEVINRVGEPRRVDTRAAVAWLKRQIAFENEPLGEVAAEFNRYGQIELEIDDEGVGALPVTGVFNAYDADSFVAFLETLQGVVVQRTPTRIRVQSLATVGHEQKAIAH